MSTRAVRISRRGLSGTVPFRGFWRLLLLFLLAAGAAGLYLQIRRSPAGGSPPAPVTPALPAEGFRAAARHATPAVASILSSKTIKLSLRDIDPFWREFLGPGYEAPRQYRERGLGSGVVVGPDGYVLTNEHVITGATDIRVVLPDQRELKAKVVGSDPKTDLAVLKVDAKNLPNLTLADSAEVEVGDIVLAIGNPFGVGESVTMGIVSAKARRGVVDPERYEDFIQTDAAINPGNSGGALITARGELIAINTAIISRSGGNQGIGFAVPSNVARHVMGHIVEKGRVVRGWLGVSIQPVDAATAKAFGLDKAAGALVGGVTPGSPADKAGIERGDIILELNGERLADSSELRMKVGMAAPNSTATLKIVRQGRERSVTATLGELPEERAVRPGGQPEEEGPLSGLQLSEISPRVARQLGLPAGTAGVVIEEIEPGAPAEEAGLRRGDAIVEVNRRPVRTVDEVRAAFRAAGKAPVILFVNRAGRTFYVVLDGGTR